MTWLEGEIDRLNAELAPLKSFILPGGSEASAWLHLARTVVRRAERRMTQLAAKQTVNPEAIKYINRLSDHLFVLARRTRAAAGQYAPPAPVALVLALVALVGLTSLSVGLSGAFGVFREVIVVPAVTVLAFGSRLMVRIIAVATIVAVAAAGVAQGLPLSSVPAVSVRRRSPSPWRPGAPTSRRTRWSWCWPRRES